MKAIKFEAEWCAPCRMLKPIWDKLEQELQGKVDFEVVDIDKYPQKAANMGVSAVPTIVFVDGDSVLDSVVGLATEDRLRDKIEELLGE